MVVHCHSGVSRSTTLVMAYLMSTHGLGLQEGTLDLTLAQPQPLTLTPAPTPNPNPSPKPCITL